MSEQWKGRSAPLRERVKCVDLPLVSVVMITYNHEKWIAGAIESVLDQETDFPVELIIGEDASTDGTRAIVEDYAARYPAVIKLLPPEQNLGMHANFRRTLHAAKGKYVALLEGDDRWTCPTKLSMQTLILEADNQCSMCFHQTVIEYSSSESNGFGEPGSVLPNLTKDTIEFHELVKFNFLLPTASVVFRRALLGDLPKWADSLRMIDLTLFTFLADLGRVQFIDRAMSVYLYGHGVSSRFDSMEGQETQIDLLMQYRKHVCRANSTKLDLAILGHLYSVAHEFELAGKIDRANRHLIRSLFLELVNGTVPRRSAAWWIRLSFPRLHRILRLARNFVLTSHVIK